MFITTPAHRIKVAEVYRDSTGTIMLRIKQNKSIEEISLAQFLDLVYQAAGEPA